MATNKRVLVTGGGTFLGDNIAAALLAEGAEVTLLVRPGAEDKLGPLEQRVRWWTADVWEPSSLKGRARGNHSVVHTVGSMTADPAHGLTYHWLNFASARNVANLCVSGGVQHMVLLSSARAPWIPREYIAAKREAEEYMERVGLQSTIIRAPIAYMRGRPRHPLYRLMTLLGVLPPFSWLGFRRIAPMAVDVLARGVARIALEPHADSAIFYARDLRRRNNSREIRQGVSFRQNENGTEAPARPANPLQVYDEDVPFGWTPPEE